MKNNQDAPSLGAASILIGSQFAIGAAAIFAKLALTGCGAVMAAALRLTIATAIILLVSLRYKSKVVVPRQHEILFAGCGFALAVHFSTWIAALDLTTVAIATLLVSTAPVWTTLYDLLILHRRPSRQFWYGFFATIAGAILAIFGEPGLAGSHTGAEQMLGAGLALAGGVAFAGYLLAVRHVSDRYGTLFIVNRTYAWSAAFLWIGALLFRQGLPASDLTCWSGIIGMAVFSQLLGHTGMNRALKTFSPNVVALSTLLEPVFAAVVAYFVFHEQLGPAMLIGALLIVAGLVSVMSAQVDEPMIKAQSLPEI